MTVALGTTVQQDRKTNNPVKSIIQHTAATSQEGGGFGSRDRDSSISSNRRDK
jgi:hypothetical protein